MSALDASRPLDARRGSARPPLRVLFVNENAGGHVTMHRAIRETITAHPDVVATFLDLPRPGLVRRVARAPLPGLARLDLDGAPLRDQLVTSFVARRLLARLAGSYDVLHVYTQHAALLSARQLAASPSILATDATGRQVSRLLPYRRPTRWTPLQDALRRPFERRAYAGATFVVGKSNWCNRSLSEEYQVPPVKLRRIPYGIPVPPGPVHHTARRARPTVTFIGRTLDRKGGDRLLRVHRERIADLCDLNIVTHDDVPSAPGVRVLRDFEPGDLRLPGLLAATDVLAFPSEVDTFGYAALEAMSMGVPVVATRLNALPEVVQDGVTGVLIDPDDAQLACALERLLIDDGERERMGRAARRRVEMHFDARATTATLVDLVHEAYSRFSAATGSRATRRSVDAHELHARHEVEP